MLTDAQQRWLDERLRAEHPAEWLDGDRTPWTWLDEANRVVGCLVHQDGKTYRVTAVAPPASASVGRPVRAAVVVPGAPRAEHTHGATVARDADEVAAPLADLDLSGFATELANGPIGGLAPKPGRRPAAAGE